MAGQARCEHREPLVEGRGRIGRQDRQSLVNPWSRTICSPESARYQGAAAIGRRLMAQARVWQRRQPRSAAAAAKALEQISLACD